jgi:D-alanyl-D-alanine carboxypeptidase (penicillin-binding protein 5/6)
MTALVVLEHRNLDEVVVITNEMVGNLGDYAAIGLRAGQRVTIEDLLYATMLPSAGDAAQALAIYTSGSIANFANVMNQKAKELGLKNTHFSNPVGMNEDNYSTAHDMAIILQAALKNKTFAKIFQTYRYQLKSVNLTAEKTFTKRPDIIGGKTGYTQLAGRCLASNSKLNGVNYILVTLGANPNSTEHLKDASRIYTYVKETYIEREILRTGDYLKTFAVTDSKQKTLEIRSKQDVHAILHKDMS